MKITIKVPEAEEEHGMLWPTEYQGKTVEVEVVGINFSDGSYWSVASIGGEIVTEKSLPLEKLEVSNAPLLLSEVFGQKLESIDINFK